MTDVRLTDEQIEEIRRDIATGKCDVWPHNDTIIEALRELKAAREEIAVKEATIGALAKRLQDGGHGPIVVQLPPELTYNPDGVAVSAAMAALDVDILKRRIDDFEKTFRRGLGVED